MGGVAVSGGCRHSAGVSVSTLTTFPLLTCRTSVEGSRTGLLLEVMPSLRQGWPTAPSGAWAPCHSTGPRSGSARTSRQAPWAFGTATGEAPSSRVRRALGRRPVQALHGRAVVDQSVPRLRQLADLATRLLYPRFGPHFTILTLRLSVQGGPAYRLWPEVRFDEFRATLARGGVQGLSQRGGP